MKLYQFKSLGLKAQFKAIYDHATDYSLDHDRPDDEQLNESRRELESKNEINLFKQNGELTLERKGYKI